MASSSTYEPDTTTSKTGRYLQRFLDTGHQYTDHITPGDLAFAELVAPPESVTAKTSADDCDYPVEWVESLAKFRRFLHQWRKLYVVSETDKTVTPRQPRLRKDPPVTPRKQSSFTHLEISTPSVSPLSRLGAFPDLSDSSPSADPASETIRLLADFTLNSSGESPKSPGHIETPEQPRAQSIMGDQGPLNPPPVPPPQPQPLTAADAANLIAAAFERYAQFSNAGNQNGALKADEVGYFNPSLPDPQETGAVAQGKQTIYTDVWSFTDRLMDLSRIYGEQKVKAVWITCLQNTALAWHTTELTETDKAALNAGPLFHICDKLQTRFKKNHSDALASLQNSRFTLYDLKNGHQLRPFIQKIIRDGKACDYTLKNQLLSAFEALEPRIQAQLSKPTSATTLGQFLEQIDDRESVFRGMAEQLNMLPAQNIPGQQQLPAYYGKQTAYVPPQRRQAQPANQPYYQPNRNRAGLTQAGRGNPNYRAYQRQDQLQPNYQNRPNQYPQRGAYAGRGNTSWRGNNNWRNMQTRPYQNHYQQANPPPQQYNRAPNQNARAYFGEPEPEEFSADFVADDTTAQDGFQFDDFNAYDTTGDTMDPEQLLPYSQQQHDPIMSCGTIPQDFGPPHQSSQDPDHDVTNFGSVQDTAKVLKTCSVCNKHYRSNNKLHDHIRTVHPELITDTVRIAIAEEQEQQADAQHADSRMDIQAVISGPPKPSGSIFDIPSHSARTKIKIVRSSVDSRPDVGTGFTYRSRTYLKIYIIPSLLTEREVEVCADTGCTRTIADKHWACREYPNAEIRTRATPLVIKGIADQQHTTSEYIVVQFFFKGVRDGATVLAGFVREITLVEGLQANLLVGMDILDSENFDIILSKSIAVIQSCKVAIPLSTTPGRSRNAKVRLARSTTVPRRSHMMLPVVTGAAIGEDSLFEPTTDLISCYAALADDSLVAIPVRNDYDHDIYLHKHITLGYLSPIAPDSRVYCVQEAPQELALRQPQKNKKPYDPGFLISSVSSSAPLHGERNQQIVLKVEEKMVPGREEENKRSIHVHEKPKPVPSYDVNVSSPENRILSQLRDSTTSADNTIKHPTGVTLYLHPQPHITDALYDLITEFRDVFSDTGYANVPPEEQPVYHLIPEWEKHIPKKCRVYPVNAEDQSIIDHTLHKLQEQNKIYRTNHFVPFSFPVFVIWRTLPDLSRKGRMVVDVRTFNNLTLTDAYPMRSQDEILAKMAGKDFITIMDALAFYYQWLTHPSTRSLMTITTARGQFTFNCLVMGYKNSNAYVQRQMDTLLHHITAADCYCDDICVSSSSFDHHYRDLYDVLSLLRAKNISIGPSKTFVGFPNAVVLGRMVDSFGLSTTKERLAAIAKIQFPLSLKDLETFIGLAGYLRHNVPRYAQLLEPLEDRKTSLLRINPRKGTTK